MGDLVLTRRVDRGGTATIYEARLAGRLVVCKLLAQQHDGHLELVRRMRDEGRLLAELGDGAWPHLVDRGELPDGRPFLLMERLSGRSLGKHLRRFGAVAPGRARRWLRSVLAGLATLHAHGLVHCDLKPENLFLCHDGRLKLLDLGAVEAAGRALAAPMGTPPYMAPEQHAGGQVDARTDVFAAGWLAADLLGGGRWPFGWRGIVERARAVDPADRFASAASLAAALG